MRSDGSGVGAANRVRLRCQPTTKTQAGTMEARDRALTADRHADAEMRLLAKLGTALIEARESGTDLQLSLIHI